MMNAVSVKMQHSIFAELVLSLFAFYIVQCRIHSRIMKAIEFINPETKDARFKFLSVLIVEKTLGMPSKSKKKKQKCGTLSQKVGGGPNRIPNFSHSSNGT